MRCLSVGSDGSNGGRGLSLVFDRRNEKIIFLPSHGVRASANPRWSPCNSDVHVCCAVTMVTFKYPVGTVLNLLVPLIGLKRPTTSSCTNMFIFRSQTRVD